MLTFFKTVLRHFLALCTAIALFLAIIIFIFIGLEYWIDTLTTKHAVPEHGFLEIDLSANITETPANYFNTTSWADFLKPEGQVRAIALYDLLEGIQRASVDPRIAGIFLKGTVDASWSVLEELRGSLEKFKKESGKPIFAYLEQVDSQTLYVTSIADSNAMHPLGSLELSGLRAENLYFKSLFDKYGIGVQATQAGRYKTAIEPFTRTDLSQEGKNQLNAILEDLWSNALQMISEGLKLDLEHIENFVNNYALASAEEALELGFIQSIGSKESLLKPWQMNGFKRMALSRYLKGVRREKNSDFDTAANHNTLAIVYLNGDITAGQKYRTNIGCDYFCKLFDKLANDETIHGVLVRINSPGGEALASEKIHQSILELQEKKPVVISMGSTAASGGYWVASAADTIFANNNTITGSIGVFGLAFNFKALAEHFDIFTDAVQTNPLAGLKSSLEPKNELLMKRLDVITQNIYKQFVTTVAKRRTLAPSKVYELAEGRVYTGKQASFNELIDYIGGMQLALAYLKNKTELQHPHIAQYPNASIFQESLFSLFGPEEDLEVSLRHLNNIFNKKINVQAGTLPKTELTIYARLPFLNFIYP